MTRQPVKTQTNSKGDTKPGEYHLRKGGRGSYVIRNYGTEGALREAYQNWLMELHAIEAKFDNAVGRLLLEEFEAITGRALPLEVEIIGGMGNPFVAEALDSQGLDAPVDVYLGETTLDEMCLGIFGLAIPRF